jgi:transposase
MKSLRKTAKLLQVSHSSIQRWIKHPEKKTYTKKTIIQYKSIVIVDIIKLSIINDPFISLCKLKELIQDTMKIEVSKELIRIAIHRLGITKKKARFYGAPSTLPKQTEEFIIKRQQFLNEGRNFISIDETSFGRNGINVRGYSKKGEKLYIKKKNARMTTSSAVVAVSKNNIEGINRLHGSFNSDKFLDFISFLNLQPKTVILLDNVKFHHSKKVKEFCQQQMLDLLYVPPYSPWFNPIELCFSIIKREFYKHQDIDRAFHSITSFHLNAFFSKSLTCEGSF